MLSPVQNQLEMGSFVDQVATTLAAHNFFHTNKPIYVARAPGRLDVMGGNVDYTGGMVLQSLLREAVWIAIQSRPDDLIRIFNPGALQFGWKDRIECKTTDLGNPENLALIYEKCDNSRWCSYVLGALHFLWLHYGWRSTGGANLFISSDLPPNKGVSSSAALSVATLKAASAALGITLDGIALATAGQWVENVVVGSACGIMDQAAIVLGRENHLLPMLCQPCQPFPVLTLPASVRIWGMDSMTPRSTTGAAYEIARAAAFMGYKLICRHEGINVVPAEASEIPRWTDARWNGYISNLAPSEFRSKYERMLPESLSGHEFLARAGEHVDPFTSIVADREYPVRSAIRYATEENLRVQMVAALLETAAWRNSYSTLQLIGEIFHQSHVAYTECGLGAESCDLLVSLARKAGFPGAKMTGGGAGGVVAILGRASDQHAIHVLAQEYAAECGARPHIFEGSSDGVDSSGIRTLQLSPAQGLQ